MNPELGIPADEKENPVNYRIIRLRKLVKETMIAKSINRRINQNRVKSIRFVGRT